MVSLRADQAPGYYVCVINAGEPNEIPIGRSQQDDEAILLASGDSDNGHQDDQPAIQDAPALDFGYTPSIGFAEGNLVPRTSAQSVKKVVQEEIPAMLESFPHSQAYQDMNGK